MLNKVQLPQANTRRRGQSQAAPVGRRKAGPPLKLVPRNVTRSAISVAEQSVTGMRRNFLRYFDFHPALALLTAFAILAVVSVIYLRQVTAVTNANYAVQALQVENGDLMREQQDLEVQIGRAQSLTRIQDIATKNLNMVPIGEKYSYITIPKGPLAAMPPIPTPALPEATPAAEP